MLKDVIKTILPKSIVNYLSGRKKERISYVSYSQEGEDMILRRIFENQKIGFYIDVGAHHPKRFSNTYFFYKKGWNGINIDAMPGSMTKFNKIRPRDINIEKPVSSKTETIIYYSFNEPALNGFSKELSEKRDGLRNYYIKSKIKIEAAPLKEILDNNLPKNQEIDFLSIDVEGFDFIALKSNDFKKFRPKVILIEILESKLIDLEKNAITIFLFEKNYSIYAKSINTVIFIENDFYNKKY